MEESSVVRVDVLKQATCPTTLERAINMFGLTGQQVALLKEKGEITLADGVVTITLP